MYFFYSYSVYLCYINKGDTPSLGCTELSLSLHQPLKLHPSPTNSILHQVPKSNITLPPPSHFTRLTPNPTSPSTDVVAQIPSSSQTQYNIQGWSILQFWRFSVWDEEKDYWNRGDC